MKLSNKLFISFSLVTLLLVIISTFAWNAINNLTRQQNVNTLAENTTTAVLEARISATTAVAKSKPEYLTQVTTYIDTAKKQVEILKATAKNEQILKLIADIDNQLQGFAPILQEMNSTFKVLIDGDAKITKIGNDILNKIYTIQNKAFNTDDTELLSNIAQVKSLFILARLNIANYFNAKDAPSLQKAESAIATAIEYAGKHTNNPELADIIKNINLYFQEASPLVKGIELLQENLQKGDSKVISLTQTGMEISKLSRSLFVEERATIIMQIAILSGLAIFISIFLSIFINKNVMNQLGADPSELSKIADQVAKGEFTINDSTIYTGVYKNITDMVIEQMKQTAEIANAHSRMQQTAQKLEQVSQVASAASMELSVQIEHSENGAQLQADQVATTATALEEMSATVLEIAKNASVTAESATSVKTEAFSGSSSMQECVLAMQDVRSESLKLQEEMSVLSGHAQAINEIMNVISDIADQTNLLALNAAIEAARAGEAGRGFAVVADEVRNLAEKTMTSTADVGNAIFAIQKSTADNTHLVSETVEKIEKVTDMLSKTDNSLQAITSLADTTADQIHAIATASEEQSSTSEEITHSVESINKIAKANTKTMQDARLAVQEVVNQTKILSNLIEELQTK